MTLSDTDLRDSVWAIAASVTDPDIPALTIAELGILRDVKVARGEIEIFIAPVDPASPARHVVALNVECALESAGYGLPRVTTVVSPPWSESLITPEGRAKLEARGLAPPSAHAGSRKRV